MLFDNWLLKNSNEEDNLQNYEKIEYLDEGGNG